MCTHCNCSLIRSLRLASFKVCLCVIVLSVTICTVEYVCSFRRHQIFVDFVSFLCMIIYEVLYTYSTLSRCLRYPICSVLILVIRISTFSLRDWVTSWLQGGRWDGLGLAFPLQSLGLHCCVCMALELNRGV